MVTEQSWALPAERAVQGALGALIVLPILPCENTLP